MASREPNRPERGHQPAKAQSSPATYYFAYGSNLCLDQMKKRCPKSRYIGVARLSNHQWHINERGYANVRAAQGHWVEGLVYEIDDEDEASLDVYEGVAKDAYEKCWTRVSLQRAPSALYRRSVAWIVNQGGPVEVCSQSDRAETAAATRRDPPTTMATNTLTYINLDLTGDSRPKKEYIGRMNMGIADAMALGVSEDYVRRYMRPFIPSVAPFDPRESEPASSSGRGRNNATASQSRVFSSQEKSRASSLPPERKRESRHDSRGRSEAPGSSVKDSARPNDGSPPLPPRPPVEEAPRQSSWRWWPFSR